MGTHRGQAWRRRAHRRIASALVGAALVSVGLATGAAAAPQTGSPPTAAAAGATVPHATAGGDFARRVEIRGGRKLFLQCRGRGGPTVVLVSGFRDGADIWSHLDPGARGPSVMAGAARMTRVCAYDRPNTILVSEGRSRSDPVPQPRTAADAVAELHALLRAARQRGPYVLVAHSYGGLVARLYASTYPSQVAGLVLVDVANERLKELFTPEELAALNRENVQPPPDDLDPPIELADFGAGYDQMTRARAARPLRPTLPLEVLSRGLPQLPPDAELPPPLPDAVTYERNWQAGQDWLAALLPHARHVVARRSGHYIQNAQPGLVIDAVRRVLGMVRPATVRCRGGADSCRAPVSLAGGASDKRVVIDLPDTDLRLVSVRPNRRSLRGSYALSDLGLRGGGSQFVVRLDAVQSIPRGSELTFTFRASGDA